jgi:regulator of nonsense transcripts 1
VTCNGGQRSIATGTAKVNGRTATVALQAALHGTRICSVTTIGKEAPTSAEAMRGDVILKALQNTSHIMRNPFVRNIYLNEVASWAGIPPLSSGVALQFPGRELNTSQKKAVSAILSNDDASRITLVHGPPGTGKTTVIASAVTSVMTSRNKSLTFWLVAQSNVAVKNIAEKLAAVGFLDFKLLVSKDFHFDWSARLCCTILAY